MIHPWLGHLCLFWKKNESCRLLACLDIYPNIDRIRKIQCPVLIIHGCLDQEVDVSHGQELYRAVPTQYQREPWWVRDRGHNDITDGPGKLAEYIRRLRHFVTQLDHPITTDVSSDGSGGA
jgi:abhydrolase domain-containing protein 17